MKIILSILFIEFITLIGCDSNSTGFNSKSAINTADSIKNKELETKEEDCVFDTSTYKFTIEALRKQYKNKNIFWDTSTANGLVPLENGDTLVLHIGGCNHFSFSAEYRTDSSKFNDSAYVVEKCRWLAETFFYNDFDKQFSDEIRKNKFYSNDNNDKNWRTYSIIVNESEITNNVYDGFGAHIENNRAIISILGYIN